MTLVLSSSGKAVRKLQEDLKSLRLYRKKIDGKFGRFTREAVLSFQERYFVDGIVDNHTTQAIDRAVTSWANRKLNIIVSVPHGVDEIEEQFGKIEYVDVDGGYIQITNDFASNIERYDYPIIGLQYLHKDLIPVFKKVLEEIRDRGLDNEIKQIGTWCPRHKMYNLRYGLSMHSYGIAIDVNQATNLPGTRGNINMGIVEVFERFGFEWGGRWNRRRDPMHFQLATGA